MAFDDLDEHEQGELVRKWLRENALSIVVGVLMGIVLIFGWQQWKARQAHKSVEAAVQYHALEQALTAKRDEDVQKIAATLRDEHPKSAYAVFAAMNEAGIATAKNDLASAATALDWARSHAGNDALKTLASLRLAQVKLAQGDANAALSLADGAAKGDYAGVGGELRGDALAKLGRSDEARQAYADALSSLDAQAPGRSFVQMKLDNLGGAPAAASATDKVGS